MICYLFPVFKILLLHRSYVIVTVTYDYENNKKSETEIPFMHFLKPS